jgi:hypothetical protein
MGHQRVGFREIPGQVSGESLIACDKRGSRSIAVRARASQARSIQFRASFAIDCADAAVESERMGEPPKAGHGVSFSP